MNQLINVVFMEMNTVHSEDHKQSLNTLCVKMQLFVVKAGGAHAYHRTLKSEDINKSGSQNLSSHDHAPLLMYI